MFQPEVVIDGLDVFDVMEYINRKKKKFLAISLGDIEEVLPADSEEYKYVRKIILDNFNDFTRSLLRTLFGDIEGLVMK